MGDWVSRANPFNMYSWRNKKTKEYVAIVFRKNKWCVINQYRTIKRFETREEAIRYAKEYIKKGGMKNTKKK